jgi:hypothetical protein
MHHIHGLACHLPAQLLDALRKLATPIGNRSLASLSKLKFLLPINSKQGLVVFENSSHWPLKALALGL